MHAWEEIQKTIDYIEEHIDEEISIESLARMASLSQFYYQRLFHRLVSQPVREYIKLRRLAKAKDALLQTQDRIVDIALRFGFTSHEHFSRTFKDEFGVSPSEFLKHPQRMNHRTKPELLLSYALIDEGVPLITDHIIIEIHRRQLTESRLYAGFEKRMPVEFGQGLGVESGVDPLDLLWNEFHDQKKNNIGFIADSEEIGVMLPDQTQGFYRYYAGARVNTREVKEPYQRWELSAGDYICCYFEAESFEALVLDALFKAQKYLTSIWLPKHNLEVEPFCMEYYESHTLDTTKMEIWVKIREEKEDVPGRK